MKHSLSFKRAELVFKSQCLMGALLLLAITLSTFAPLIAVYAQEEGSTTQSEQSDFSIDAPETAEPTDASQPDGNSEAVESAAESVEADSENTPEVVQPTEVVEPAPVEVVPQDEQVVEVLEPVATTTEPLIPTGEKFKKKLDLPLEEQLALVRQHLLREGLPQVALERLSAYESQIRAEVETKNILEKAWDFITGNTEEAANQREAERLIKQKPFKVEGFEGKLNVSSARSYESEFVKAREHGSFLQKVKNLIKSGSFINEDPHKTKEKRAPLSWLFGSNKAVADVSNDPQDYLNEGGEIAFTQAIQDQATALDGDPLKILNFVRNNVEYVPYYGSKKGSNATLLELAGNDTDKASLLIALLRTSDIAARYRQVDAKMSIETANELFGTNSATTTAQIMSMQRIPYVMYVQQDGQPAFFVIEHTYVEAWLPYGVSRGADVEDGGLYQWVPMDPSINSYTYEQPIDVVEEMNTNGFDIETFFDNYLDGDYGVSTEPLAAFKTVVEDFLASTTLDYYPDLAYEDVLTRSYPGQSELSFVPGSLPYEIAADLDTYGFIPASLRHTVEFTVTEGVDVVLNHTAYVSDLADQEVLITYEAATQDDQDIIDSFDTIYDVVPLSLVAVKPVLKVNGDVVETGSATTTPGRTQAYQMEFYQPDRDIGGSVVSELVNDMSKKLITGTTDGIAINTDRMVPPLLRPDVDAETGSFTSDQLLYQTATEYLFNLQDTHGELAAVTGGDFAHVASRVAIGNGVEVTHQSGQPYSFEWVGLRIDAALKVRYFNRVNPDSINSNRKEFFAVFGLQASQEESDIFEENFDVESIATVKGLKMVADGEFAGVTLEKITSANQSDINSLLVSTSTKNAFTAAVNAGKTIYTPSEPITYEDWNGLFYIAVDIEDGDATYAIGEGLNGGYTVVEQWDSGWENFWRRWGTFNLDVTINSPTNGATYNKGQNIPWSASYTSVFKNWTETLTLKTTKAKIGPNKLQAGYGQPDYVTVNIIQNPSCKIGSINPQFDADICQVAAAYGIPKGILKAMIHQETGSVQNSFDPRTSRYEPKRDYDDFQKSSPNVGITNTPYSYYVLAGKKATGETLSNGSRVNKLKTDPYTVIKNQASGGWFFRGVVYADRAPYDGIITVAELYANDLNAAGKSRQGWPTLGSPSGYTGNFTPQFAISSSYGLGHTMYYESTQARNMSNQLIMKSDNTPQDLVHNTRLGIEVAASILKAKYNIVGNAGSDNCAGWSDALLAYNGGGDPNYVPNVCKYYRTNYPVN